MISSWLILLAGIYPKSILSSSILQDGALNSSNTDLTPFFLDEGKITILNIPSSRNASLSQSLSAPPALNASRPNLSLSNGTDRLSAGVTTKCAGDKYGFDLNVPSCQEAWSILPKSASLRTGRQRHSTPEALSLFQNALLMVDWF